ncbi:MAG TPA: hypothetical protein VIN58_01050 [Roseateles sp.]
MEKVVTIGLGRLVLIVLATAAVMFVVVGVIAVREVREVRDDEARLAAQKSRDAQVQARPKTPDPLAPERAAFMRKLLDAGVVARIELRGDFVRLWVREPFYLADFADKQKVAAAVFRHCQDELRECLFVAIADGRTGKRVGQFSIAAGLQID